MNATPKITQTGLSGHTASGLWLRRMGRLPSFSNVQNSRVQPRIAAELTLHPLPASRFFPESEAARKSVDARRVA